MPAATPDLPETTLAPEFVGRVVREVLARLRAGQDNDPAPSRPDGVPQHGVISVATIEAAAADAKTKQLMISPKAVVTPAAVDEATKRGIRLIRSAHRFESAGGGRSPRGTNPTASGTPDVATGATTEAAGAGIITDSQKPERAEAILEQLQRRNVRVAGCCNIRLSDSPAAETYRQIAAGKRAVMIRQVADVRRFVDELDPQIWVLDMKDLTFVAAVNTVRQILQLSGGSK